MVIIKAEQESPGDKFLQGPVSGVQSTCLLYAIYTGFVLCQTEWTVGMALLRFYVWVSVSLSQFGCL